jgi:hypothetical protein
MSSLMGTNKLCPGGQEKLDILFVCVFFSLAVLRIEFRVVVHARQVLYH